MRIRSAAAAAALILAATFAAVAQDSTVIRGTALIYGQGPNLRTRTASFQLRLKGTTSDADAAKFLSVLKNDGQDALQKAIHNEDLGTFSLGNGIGITVNAVRVQDMDGKRKIYVVFERWLGTAELRYGYRSLDYPFSYMEITLDKETGKGEGIYFAAARIRWKDRDSQPQIEVENFETFPSKLMSVQESGRKL